MIKAFLARLGFGRQVSTPDDGIDHGGPERADAAAKSLRDYLDAPEAAPAAPGVSTAEAARSLHTAVRGETAGGPSWWLKEPSADPNVVALPVSTTAGAPRLSSAAAVARDVQVATPDGAKAVADPQAGDVVLGTEAQATVQALPGWELKSAADLDVPGGLDELLGEATVGRTLDEAERKLLFNSTRMRRNRVTGDLAEAAAYARRVVADVRVRLHSSQEGYGAPPDLTEEQQREFDVIYALAKLRGLDADTCRHHAYFAAYKLADTLRVQAAIGNMRQALAKI